MLTLDGPPHAVDPMSKETSIRTRAHGASAIGITSFLVSH